MFDIRTIYESSGMNGIAHVSCVKYKNLNNIAHYHKDHELVYVCEGNAFVSVKENLFHLKNQECIFIHSNDIHYIQSDQNTVIIVLKAKSQYFKSIFASQRLLHPILKEDLNVEAILNAIGSELTGCMENSSEMSDSLAKQFLITMLRREQTVSCDNAEKHKPDTTTIYHEIGKKISAEYSTITFKEMAKHMHFSEPYFSKFFQDLFGMTFTQYLNTVRIAAAIEKIRHTNLSITEISANCGFNTIRNFNRVFKRLTGYSPNRLPVNYIFLYSLQDGCGLNPTLNCTEIIEW